MTKFTNPNGSTYNFVVENFSIYIEAKGKSGKVFMFSIASDAKVIDGELETKQGKNLPVYDNAEAIQSLIDGARTRTLKSFSSHDDMMNAVRSSEKEVGSCFEKDGSHCFYEYN